MDQSRAEQILTGARTCRIAVLGDVMLDEFIWGEVTRISPEAPVPVVNVQRESTRLGGAANVLANLAALGAAATVVGVIGKDSAAEKLRESLRANSLAQAADSLIIDDKRPTTIKTRIIAHHQMVVRADREFRGQVNGQIEARIIDTARAAVAAADALVVSDYDKGVITPRVLSEVLPAAYQRIPVLVDPKIRNFDSYRPASLVTPNHHEALRLTGSEEDTDEGLKIAAEKIRERLSCDAVLVTRGECGMMLAERDQDPIYVKTAAREVFDVTGAGDTVIAMLATALAVGASMTEAAVLANQAAGIVVGKLGTATASAREIISSFA